MTLTVLAGSTFCVSDDLGDLVVGPAGLYADDTRHLSRLLLTVDGERPLLVASRNVEHFTAFFCLRNRPSPTLPENALLISRDRFVGGGLQDRLVATSQAMEPIAFELALELDADFADIITVKEHAIVAGPPAGLRPLPPPSVHRVDPAGQELVLSDAEGGGGAQTEVVFSRPAAFGGDRALWRVELAPGERWELRVDVCQAAFRWAAAPRRASPRRVGTPPSRSRPGRRACPVSVAHRSCSGGPTSGRSPTWRRSGFREAAVRLARCPPRGRPGS